MCPWDNLVNLAALLDLDDHQDSNVRVFHVRMLTVHAAQRCKLDGLKNR